MSVPDNASPTNGNGTTQSETAHVRTPNGIFAAWNDSSQWVTAGTQWTSLVSWRGSTDGTAFSGGGYLSFPDGMACGGDPTVVADSAGYVYIAALARTGSFYTHFGVARSTGTLPPFSFGEATLVAGPEGTFVDKGVLSIDRTGGPYDNRIYLTAEGYSTGRIAVAHSTSLNPPAFSDWQPISPPPGGAEGAAATVGPNGEVYTVWVRGGNTYEIVKSTDGGSTFANPDPADPAPAKVIATVNPSPSVFGAPGKPIKVLPWPEIASDHTAPGSPTRGYVYVVFHADPDGPGPDIADVFFTRSIDGGVTWSTPRSITSGPAATIGRDTTTNDSWNPSIVVSPVNGHVHITFYDRREDTTTSDGDPVNTRTRLYRAFSTDAGQTFNAGPLGSSSFVPVAGIVAGSSNYFGEYNSSQADANGLTFTWGDSRNKCAPPVGAANPCTPAGRPDLDTYFRAVPNLSGPDLFIKPWGEVTGEGPQWQTPYVYVVDGSDVQVNAAKGVVNRLRARVRNLGSAAASGALVRFRYAPWFAGINDTFLKEVGAPVAVSFSAAGGGMDDLVVPIDWDLTNMADTNGGLWPQPVGAFEHFCVKVTVEFPGDINLSNNEARSNFFDVKPATALKYAFLVLGPSESERTPVVSARLGVNRLPAGFGVTLMIDGEDAQRGFRLGTDQVKAATVAFTMPRAYVGAEDVVADISLLVNGQPHGGISARLYRARDPRQPADVIGPTKSRYWEVVPADRTEKVPCQRQATAQPPPMRTIPRAVPIRRSYRSDYETVYRAILAVVRERNLGPDTADFDRGLVNSRGVDASREEIARLVAYSDVATVKTSGFVLTSIWLEPRDVGTEVGVEAWIATNHDDAPLGFRHPSNETLERSLLDEVGRLLGE